MAQRLEVEWLKSAYSDILMMERALDSDFLTHMVAFHSQQAIEKSFKALIIYKNDSIEKTHDIFRLYLMVQNDIGDLDETLIERINEIYIEARYPGSLGLLPYGKPTIDDSKEFYKFAKDIFDKVCKIIDVSYDDLLK
ncbi:MAG: HEPN domain-containing protein [Epsilonproteobacteria bacterium]|nr:HEPN domain-containing protein [Campylobacterota bacterium]